MAKGRGKHLRRLPPLDSESGRISVEQTRQFLTEQLGTAYTQPEIVGTPTEHLTWTATLPGFAEARESAFGAWMQSEAESAYWREMAAAADAATRHEITARQQINLGLGSPEAVTAELLKHVPPARAFRILTDASRNGENNQSPPRHAYDVFSQAEEERLTGPFPAKEMADGWTLVAGRRSSPRRRLFVVCWIHGGLWLSEMPDAAAFLATRRSMLPEFASLSDPSAETLRVWKSELGLLSYQGKGRLQFDQNGNPRLDQTLQGEIQAAFDASERMILAMSKPPERSGRQKENRVANSLL